MFSKITIFLAALGALVLANQTREALLGDDCCSGSKWQAHTADYKLGIVWEKIVKNLKSGSWPGINLAFLFVESMDPSFDRVADDLPWDRSKLIHSVGSHAVVSFQVNSLSKSKYTGIFATGAHNGIVRLSPAAEPEPDKVGCDPQCGFTPGMGLKLFRSGVRSANMFEMFMLEGQESFNFFENTLTNHPILHCEDRVGSLGLLYNKFATASNYPTTIGLSDFAFYDENGQVYNTPKFPYELLMQPNDNLTKQFPTSGKGWTDERFAEQMASIPSGTVIYTVLAIETPNAAPQEIGFLQTLTNFTTSNWGDRNMFLQHTRMEEDLVLRPSWKSFVPTCP